MLPQIRNTSLYNDQLVVERFHPLALFFSHVTPFGLFIPMFLKIAPIGVIPPTLRTLV